MSAAVEKSASEALEAAVSEASRGGEQDAVLVRRYLRHASAEDLVGRSPESLVAQVKQHRDFAAQRSEGEPNIRLVQSAAADGKPGFSTQVEIVTDDMPFLVDSVIAALQGSGATVQQVLHPQLLVRRDEQGQLLEVVDADVMEGAEGAIAESWISADIHRVGDEETRERITRDLTTVLEDVRASVADWQAMRNRCETVARDLSSQPPHGVDEKEVAKARRLLAWLADNHFTFLGYREYDLDELDGELVLRPVEGSGLGILRNRRAQAEEVTRLRPEAQRTAREPNLLTITKANSRATVHRSTYLDYVGLKRFDEQGNVIGERRFLGLLTSSAYAESALRVPVIDEKVREVLSLSGFAYQSHSGKDLLTVLENYPRDELFQSSVEELAANAAAVVTAQERRSARLFVRPDQFGRFVSALVFIPKDRYNTRVRTTMQSVLSEAFGSDDVSYATRVGEAPLAQLHYVVRFARGTEIPQVDVEQLQERLVSATRTWEEGLEDQARHAGSGDLESDLARDYRHAFPEAYKEDFDPTTGMQDLLRLSRLEADGDMHAYLYRPEGAPENERRFKLFHNSPLVLTDVLPIFTHFGLEVTEQRPYELTRDGASVYIDDFGLRATSAQDWGSEDQDGRASMFEEAFSAAWHGQIESDEFNALVLRSGLSWRQVVILRTIARYIQQTGITFSPSYVVSAMVANPVLSGLVVEYFEARFNPDVEGDRDEAQSEVLSRSAEALEAVTSLDHDRIVRSFFGVVRGALRTNFYQVDDEGSPKSRVSLKLSCRDIAGLPEPRPKYEIWVYSPRVEGVHLRFGDVARGGLRWSDRREDFRTEVLGLVKAQMVKNAVIVPTGSKGGFFAKQLPDPAADRDAWFNEGRESYKVFISAMLDITDNRDGDDVIAPERVVRHDGDDPYLVVAADKGTATFSDTANGIARDYGFWLDDAFASGGSAGYDHKGMGITARGAWESVKRHFRELGHDTQTQDFTVVGIGDMSGDVFGNGMLLSEHIRLVAAFDHRHIFIDPNPDAATSFAERKRLFEVPRSSWEDYDSSKMSEGGGVFSRQAKSIDLTPQIREVLGIEGEPATMTPQELMRAILLAPVDLLWNGGIGTYVKASSEGNTAIGDRANDAIRVDGKDLRVKVIGEGGNLGASQLGRIEAAQNGVQVNTDAIDNSAGVDTSDHEVNLKILFTDLVRSDALTLEARNELLESMTDEVADMVLRTNYEQNVVLGNGRAQDALMLPVHQRLMRWLEEHAGLDRELEFLPSDDELEERMEHHEGLTSPEFAVLLAYAKLALKDALNDAGLENEDWFGTTLSEYFPQPVRERFGDQLAGHPLRKEIIVNSIANSVINRGGVTFIFRAWEETGATPEQISRAFVICREVFGLREFVEKVEALDNKISTDAQTAMYLEFRRLIDRGTRWVVHNRPADLDVAAEIERFSKAYEAITPKVVDMLQDTEKDRFHEGAKALTEQGVPEELAARASGLLDTFSVLDIVDIAETTGIEPTDIAPTYFAVSEHFGIDDLLTRVAALPRDDRWDALARGAMRDDLYSVWRSLATMVLKQTDGEFADGSGRVEQWAASHSVVLDRATQTLESVRSQDTTNLATLSVVLRTLRGIIRQAGVS